MASVKHMNNSYPQHLRAYTVYACVHVRVCIAIESVAYQ